MDTDEKRRRLRLTIELPFVLPLPDGEYFCQFGENKTFTIGLELISMETGDADVDNSIVIAPFTGEVTQAGSAVEIPGAGGRRTRVFVDFFIKHDARHMAEEESLKWKSISRRYLNAFLDAYRVHFADPRVYTLSPAEFYAIRFGYAPRWGEIAFDGSKNWGTTFGDYPLELKHIPELQAEQVKEFRARIESGVSVSVARGLMMDAKTHESRGEFRRAVTDCGTALDIAIEEVGVNLLKREGNLNAKRRTWLSRVSPKVIAEECLSRGLDASLVESSVWKAYEPEVRQLRNAVIHDRYEPSKTQAQNAIQVIENLIQWLRDSSDVDI